MPSLKSKLVPLLRWTLETGQRFGVNVTPNHFYSDIPDFRALRRESGWRRPWSMVGVAGADPATQLRFARECCEPFRDRMAGAPAGDPRNIHETASRMNGEGGYGPTEAEFLYCFVRRHRPARIIQIGCGVSTGVLLQAVADEPGYTPLITCVEPYPTPILTLADKDGRIRLRPEPAQVTPVEFFQELGPGDLLFIDSTHTLKPGSEVLRLVFEVLPRLRPGAFVHFHDIYFPYDYPPETLQDGLFFWRETCLLYAFLLMNPHYEIAASLAMLHHAQQDGLRAILPNYRPAKTADGLYVERGHFPSSIFIRRVS